MTRALTDPAKGLVLFQSPDFSPLRERNGEKSGDQNKPKFSANAGHT